MTKAQIDIDAELWKQVRHFGVDNDLNTNELVTLALERLVMPVAGRMVPDTMNLTPDQDITVTMPKNVTPISGTPDPIASHQTQPGLYRADPGFGYSRPAPKPVGRK